jgi:hypothetical protein
VALVDAEAASTRAQRPVRFGLAARLKPYSNRASAYAGTGAAVAAVSIIVTTSSGWETIAT